MASKTISYFLLCVLLLGFCFAAETEQEDAINSIDRAKRDISIMEKSGFPTNYVHDELRDAENLILQLDYASVLRDPSASAIEKNKASRELRLINYASITYSDILIHTENIAAAKEEAFALSDEITILELKIQDFESRDFNVSIANEILTKVYDAFDFERYGEARELLLESENILEEITNEQSRANILIRGSKNFFQNYGLWVIIILGILVTVALYVREKYILRIFRKKLVRLRNELKSLDNLLRKTQEERFKHATISGLVYNIRSENYKNRIESVKSEIAVTEKRILDLGNKKKQKKPRKTSIKNVVRKK
jgi:hypothetical protein